MRKRRHHNNKGVTQAKTGKLYDSNKRIAQKLGIKMTSTREV